MPSRPLKQQPQVFDSPTAIGMTPPESNVALPSEVGDENRGKFIAAVPRLVASAQVAIKGSVAAWNDEDLTDKGLPKRLVAIEVASCSQGAEVGRTLRLDFAAQLEKAISRSRMHGTLGWIEVQEDRDRERGVTTTERRAPTAADAAALQVLIGDVRHDLLALDSKTLGGVLSDTAGNKELRIQPDCLPLLAMQECAGFVRRALEERSLQKLETLITLYRESTRADEFASVQTLKTCIRYIETILIQFRGAIAKATDLPIVDSEGKIETELREIAALLAKIRDPISIPDPIRAPRVA